MGVEDGNLGNVDSGAQPGDNGGGPLNDMGLTADEAQIFSQMEQQETVVPDTTAREPGPGDNDPPSDGELDPFDQPIRMPGNAEPTKPVVVKKDQQDESDNDPPEQDDEDLPPEQPGQHTVSYGKHRRELKKLHDKLKAARGAAGDPEMAQKYRTLEIEHAKLSERMNLVLDAINSKKKPTQEEPAEEDDPEPDVKEAPFEHQEWMRRQFVKLVDHNKKLEQRIQQTEQARTSDAEEAQLVQRYVNDCRAAATADETFPLAYQKLKNSRYVEIALTKFGKDIEGDDKLTEKETQAVVAQFRAEEQGIATRALQAGKRPSELIMRYAIARGFDKEAAKVAIAKAKGEQPAPAKTPAAKTPPAKPSVSEEVRNLRDRRENSLSLSDGGAAPGGDRITLNQIANMPQKDFNNLLERLGRDEYESVILGKE